MILVVLRQSRENLIDGRCLELKALARKLLRMGLSPVRFIFEAVFLAIAVIVAISKRLQSKGRNRKPRLVWGSDPIINLSYWSRSMGEAGWESTTLTTPFYSNSTRADWGEITDELRVPLPAFLKPYLIFLTSLIKFEIFFVSFNGFLLGHSPLWRTQAFILKCAGAKVVVIPYGSDAYVYRSTRSVETAHALMDSYPQASREQCFIARRVSYWTKHSDVVIPGFMGPDGIGRWDVLTPSPLVLDLGAWKSSPKAAKSNGTEGVVEIIHTPNHRGFKGTEFLIEAIATLQLEGLKVNLTLVEGMPNSRVRELLCNQADILVEQLVYTGHGLSALEGMASGITTVSNLEDDSIMTTFRRWTYFGECPLVSASPENITDVLRVLVKNPDLRRELGEAGRAYVEKYHGFDSSQYLFERVIRYLQEGDRNLLWNLYHPLLGEYPNRLPKITHPLEKNRVPRIT